MRGSVSSRIVPPLEAVVAQGSPVGVEAAGRQALGDSVRPDPNRPLVTLTVAVGLHEGVVVMAQQNKIRQARRSTGPPGNDVMQCR